jgi:hypothetical protein
VDGHQAPELGHDVGVSTERQFGLRASFDGRQPHLRDPDRLRRHRGKLGDIREHRTAPQAERPAEQVGGTGVVRVSERVAGPRREPFELPQIDVGRFGHEPVPQARPLDRHIQCRTEPGDLALQGVDTAARAERTVQLVHEPRRRHDPAGVQHQ